MFGTLTRNSIRSAKMGQKVLSSNLLIKNQYRSFAIIKRFTKTHEWISFDTETNVAKIGITDHAQKELGDIVYVDLPESGTEFSKSDVILQVESTKTAADVYQMVDGVVLEINEKVQDDGAIVNEDAEGDGWLISVSLENQKQLEDLLT